MLSVKTALWQQFLYVPLLYRRSVNRHALLSIKDAFLKSLITKNVLPLLHSSSPNWLHQSPFIWGRSYDTEDRTIQEEGHKCSQTDIEDLVSGVQQLGSLRRVIFSRKLASPPGDKYSIHHAIYTVPVHLNCILVSAHIPSSIQKKWFAFQTTSSISPGWLKTVSRAGCSGISSGMPNPRIGWSRELVLSLCNTTQIRDLITGAIFAQICDV